jgi:hypothetical protein
MVDKKMEKFNGVAYARWRSKLVGYLRIKSAWDTVKATDGLLLMAMQVEDSDAESKALAYLQRLVSIQSSASSRERIQLAPYGECWKKSIGTRT